LVFSIQYLVCSIWMCSVICKWFTCLLTDRMIIY